MYLTVLNVITDFLVKNELKFEPINFVGNLSKMGIGMLVIFVIIGVIIITTMLVNKIFSKK